MEFQAEVPYGLHPGQVFVMQTAVGPVQVQVPPGGMPGQKIRVVVPRHAEGHSPVLLGRVGAHSSAAGAETSAGNCLPQRHYRTDPLDARVSDLPLLQGIPVERAERKVTEIRKGGELARSWAPFPTNRKCMDSLWIIPFVVVVALVVIAVVLYSQELTHKFLATDTQHPAAASMVVAGVIGGCASLVAALLFIVLARVAPGCVVWTSLIFGPALLVAMGLFLLFEGAAGVGILCIVIGALSLSCVFCCFTPFIPFTIKIVETVAGVIKEHPMMVAVSLLGSLIGLAWSVFCGMAFCGMYLKYENQVFTGRHDEKYFIYFVAVLVLIWGGQVTYTVCHVTYCGVFGRWYHKPAEGAPLRRSLGVALTTSFGSICFGSFLIAAIRAVELLVRQARYAAQEEGNACSCVCLLMLECVVGCLGDILEYFSEWAYVQCAVRGVSFLDAARITYSLMTCSNMEFVLQDLLINSVVSLGAVLCAVVGGAAGIGAGFALGAKLYAVVGGSIGGFSGLLAGAAAAGILSSGAKALLACWAEDPEPLARLRPEVHAEFERRIL